MIRNVVFDIGKVLVDFNWEKAAAETGFSEADIELMRREVIGNRWDEVDRGVMTEEEAKEYIKEVLPGLEDKFDRFYEKLDEMVPVRPYAEDWLKSLKERGLGVYLLSNFPEKLFIYEEEHNFGFVKHADGKIISSFVKLIKPDPQIYRCLLDTYGLKAEECVFIDDREDNVKAAKECGFNGIVFTGYEDACASLENLLGANEDE